LSYFLLFFNILYGLIKVLWVCISKVYFFKDNQSVLYIFKYLRLTLYLRRASQISYEKYYGLFSYENTADVAGGKPIAVWSQSMSGVSAFILSRTPHETLHETYTLLSALKRVINYSSAKKDSSFILRSRAHIIKFYSLGVLL
jgi:hypothetical protein